MRHDDRNKSESLRISECKRHRELQFLGDDSHELSIADVFLILKNCARSSWPSHERLEPSGGGLENLMNVACAGFAHNKRTRTLIMSEIWDDCLS